MELHAGGWLRQQSGAFRPDSLGTEFANALCIPVEQMPLSTGMYKLSYFLIEYSSIPAMTGVDMRLEPGAIRELHWHNVAEVLHYDLTLLVLVSKHH